VDYLRRHRRQVSLEDMEIILHTPCPSEDLITRERNALLYRSLQDLRQPYRVVLQLHYIDEFSIPQICSILGKSTKQVYNLLNRARVALKETLEKEGMTYEDL
jgi:RNA polymerase sigma-70 factor (ECF subfamily)